MRIPCLAACLALIAAPAAAAPFAILHLDEESISLVDLGTLTKGGGHARYERILVVRNGPQLIEAPLDRHINKVEADCAGKQVRILETSTAERGRPPQVQPWGGPGDWTEVEADELRLACTGQTGGLQVIPSLDVARAILNSGSGRSAD